MLNDVLLVNYFPGRDCFVHLPKVWLSKLDLKYCVVKIEKNGRKMYASCSVNTQVSSLKSIFISTKFAECLNLQVGDQVVVSILNDPPILSSITVEADTDQDFQIITLQSEKLQSIILNQISIVSINQSFVIYLSTNLSVKMTVTSTAPSFHFGMLQKNTQVHVLAKSINFQPKKTVTHSFNFNLPLFVEKKEKLRNNIFRVCLASENEFSCFKNFNTNIKTFYHIFIHKSQFHDISSDTEYSKPFFCKLTKLGRDFPPSNSKDSSTIIQVVVMDEILSSLDTFEPVSAANNNIFICKTLQNNLQLDLGDKIYLKEFTINEKMMCKTLEITSINESFNFENYLYHNFSNQRILINSGQTKVFLQDESLFSINFESGDSYGLLDMLALKETKINIKKDILKVLNHQDSLEKSFFLNSIDPECFQTILKECLTLFRMSLTSFFDKTFICNRLNVIICGDSGSGKSTVCQLLELLLKRPPFWCYIQKVECRKLKGKKVEIINKHLQSILTECKFKQPAVLILDNLDSITNIEVGENENNSAESINAKKVAETLINLIITYQKKDWICLIATCRNTDQLGSQFELTRGVKLFDCILKLPGLMKEHRLQVLKKLLIKRFHQELGQINWETVASKTEGWMLQDLVDLAEKVAFFCWRHQQKGSTHEKVENNVINNVLETLKPAALHGVSLFSGSGYKWSEIGGLDSVKQFLIQLLQWPLKYPRLYKNSPIKQQSGVLLYGMPGTGKTLLAGAVAKECGLNFISIKGPELLSKYIGASEEAVRTIFDKAQRARPCVLFFDEFDSLAPRRGHDSTGVTDRVVNQLLTQFDGIEGREGVAIIAASSRPDLLDPALLRPGRLDKSLFCPLPDQNDRVEILTALCQKYCLNAADLNLNLIASMSDGFSGADLNAVINQARLNVFNNNNYLDKENGIIVSTEHLLQSFHSTQPSLTPKQIFMFNRIYAQFIGNEINIDLLKPKATLA